jgi:integrase
MRSRTKNGPVMADRTLAYVRKAFNWWATRDDSFVPPIVRGMARTKPTERARKRVLDDDEIRDIWAALEMTRLPAPFPSLLRTLLLTAQRRNEVARMRWEEVADNTWSIPAERRKNAQAHTVPLTGTVLRLLGKPQKSGFVFSTMGGTKPFSGFGKAKRALDETITALRKDEGRTMMSPWVLHDLRRTARSLLSRTGVSPDIGERVIGHAIPGIRGVYDRHDYADEKKDALNRLDVLVGSILRQKKISPGTSRPQALRL